jgi:SAM-dependent methyltransferase
MPINRYEDEGVARYWNKKYDQEYHPYLHGRQKKVLDLIVGLGLPDGSACLELGCASGQNAEKYVELGLHVHGVDSSDELLKTAHKLALPGSNMEFSNVDLNVDMPFEDASFDLVVVVGTLQYLLEPSACVKEVYRVLKPGGHFIVCQRNALSFNVLRRPVSFLCCILSHEGFEWGGRGGDISSGLSATGLHSVLIKRMVKFSNLQRWMRSAGLEVVYSGGYTPDFSIAPRLFRALNSILNTIPFMYRFSHVVLASGQKPAL